MFVTPRASLDIENAVNWYERQAPGLGARFLEQVDSTLLKIQYTPLIYSHVGDSIRRASLHRFPFAVYYMVHESEVHVLSVLHHARSDTTVESDIG